jgi:polygalacturonase
MGDAGNSATPGGWVRVFGRGLSLGADAAHTEIAAAATEITAAVARLDFANAKAWTAAGERATMAATHAARKVVLTLTQTNGSKIYVLAENATGFSATFRLPTTIALGEYKIEVSNGAASSSLDSYVSPEQPHVSTIVVNASTPFAARLYPVALHGCKGGLNDTGFPKNCTEAVHAAIAAAGAAGGGTVFFGVGRWYIAGPLVLPEGVLLKGAGRDLTAIYCPGPPGRLSAQA